MHRHGRVSEHGLYPGGGHHEPFICALDWVSELYQHTKLDLIFVTRHREFSATRQLALLYLPGEKKSLLLTQINKVK